MHFPTLAAELLLVRKKTTHRAAECQILSQAKQTWSWHVKTIPGQRPYFPVFSPKPSWDAPSPITHLCCQVPRQHGGDGPLQHLFATVLKHSRKEGITHWHAKRNPRETIYPQACLCPIASPFQRGSGPDTSGCRAAWEETGRTTCILLLLFAGEDAHSPHHPQAMGTDLAPQPGAEIGAVWAQGCPNPGTPTLGAPHSPTCPPAASVSAPHVGGRAGAGIWAPSPSGPSGRAAAARRPPRHATTTAAGGS